MLDFHAMKAPHECIQLMISDSFYGKQNILSWFSMSSVSYFSFFLVDFTIHRVKAIGQTYFHTQYLHYMTTREELFALMKGPTVRLRCLFLMM